MIACRTVALLTLVSAGNLAADEARELLLRGNYDEARAAFEELPAGRAVEAAVGVARTYAEVGEYDKAVARLDAALLKDETKGHPDLLAERADLLYQRGRWEDAEKDADAAIKADDAHLLGRWVKARILRDRGDLKDADDAMRWFVRTYTKRDFDDQPIEDAEELTLVGQAAAENARWHRLSDQFRFILNEVYGDALKFEPQLWRAEYLAGMMLLEKYNRPGAIDAFDNALKINPRAAEVIVAKGLAELQTLEIGEASRYAEDALKINPNLVSALRLKADVLLAAGDYEECLGVLEHAKSVNPRDEPMLARIAACHFLQKDDTLFKALIDSVSEFDSKPGVLYFELAEVLNDRRLFTAAEEYYTKAMESRPNLPGPRASIGMLYMRLGDEDKAEGILKEAFKADPFSVRVANTLKVLSHLEGYETIQTEHFDIRFDPVNDGDLAQFLAEDLERYHARFKGQFNFAPPDRILIEVFNRHDMFSGRTVALPDLHTIGACTGKVITMVSPYGKGVPKRFNWGRVIRHELTHVFNLAQTDFRVPHWFTEGLAVRNEGFTRPRDWSLLLARRLESGKLLNLNNILLGFVRPRSHEEWTLAYCQSELYVDFLTREYGPEVIGKLLDVFREGVSSAEAVERVCGIDVGTFEENYRAYLAAVAEPFRNQGTAERLLTLSELEAAVKKDPDDGDLKAQLAYQLLRRKRIGDARDLTDSVLADEPGHPLASLVRARLFAADDKPEEAREVLLAALKEHPDDARLIREMAKRHEEDGELAEAAEMLERGREVAPHAGGWLGGLAQIYNRIGRTDELVGVLRELAEQDAEELPARVRLAEMLVADEKFAEAEEFAREAMRIDHRDKSALAVLVAALEGQGRGDEAKELRSRFGD